MSLSPVSRRRLLATLVAGPAVLGTARAQARRLVVRDPGGPYTTAFKEAFYEPFRAATGIEVIGVVSPHEPTTQIKTMVEARAWTWDMALLSRAAHDQLVAERDGYLAPIDVDSPGIRATPAIFKTDHFVGNDVFAAVLAYRHDRFTSRRPPAGWADLLDPARMPGRRALRRHPFDTLEQALMADGVARDRLYPIDVERALTRLEPLRRTGTLWWSNGAQTTRMLGAGEVDLCATYSARAQAAIDEGAPVTIVWDGMLYAAEGWCILKGSPNADLARRFIAFAVDAERQARITRHLAYGPTIPDAYRFVDPARARHFPSHPDNLARGVAIDSAWWGRHKDPITERFNAWLAI